MTRKRKISKTERVKNFVGPIIEYSRYHKLTSLIAGSLVLFVIISGVTIGLYVVSSLTPTYVTTVSNKVTTHSQTITVNGNPAFTTNTVTGLNMTGIVITTVTVTNHTTLTITTTTYVICSVTGINQTTGQPEC